MLGPQESGGASAALLIIEPDATIAGLLALVLGDDGYAAECANSPDEALALLAARDPTAFYAVLSYDFARSRAAPYAWLDHLRTRTAAKMSSTPWRAHAHRPGRRAYARVAEAAPAMNMGVE